MTKEEVSYYDRHIRLDGFGPEAQQRLKGAKVLVVGAGGLGCPVLLYLATAGVGKITVLDDDVIATHNLHRQVLFSAADVGKKKALVATEKMRTLQPLVTVEAVEDRLTAENALPLIRNYDVVVDGTDNFETRYLANDACVLAGKPLVSGAIHQFSGQVSVFNFRGGPTYRCLYPEAPGEEDCTSCSVNGVLNVLPGIVATTMVNEVIKVITGYGEVLSGKVLVIDIRRNQYQLLHFALSPENHNIAALVSGPPFLKGEAAVRKFLQANPASKLIDVREEWEFEEDNMGGEHIPLGSLSGEKERIVQSQVGTLIFLCRSGKRSKAACALFERSGPQLVAASFV